MSASFDDGKDASALRTIGEVSDALGIKQHVLRYWEQQFPMLKPLKRSGGRRYYRPEDVTLVETIDRLVNSEGYTLKGAKAAIREGKPQGRPPLAVQAGVAISVEQASGGDDIRRQLKSIRNRLAAALEA
ncbi:MerR family transcriptional regulator [Altererythrobacter sp. Z27]|uniref:MerR family transcriptional regulator n=1 Tax=Altererythrobacter sp. Z27 TaxID=3461147 RepID=UPI004043BBCF